MSKSTGVRKRQLLPAVDLAIEIRRDRSELEIAQVELLVPTSRVPKMAQQLRWTVGSPMLPDELLLVFGKPLIWAGLNTRAPLNIPQVEDAFVTPLALRSGRLEALSGAPRVEFPATTDLLAWPFGIVLLRGRDLPLTAHGFVRMRRVDG